MLSLGEKHEVLDNLDKENLPIQPLSLSLSLSLYLSLSLPINLIL